MICKLPTKSVSGPGRRVRWAQSDGNLLKKQDVPLSRFELDGGHGLDHVVWVNAPRVPAWIA